METKFKQFSDLPNNQKIKQEIFPVINKVFISSNQRWHAFEKQTQEAEPSFNEVNVNKSWNYKYM